MMETNKQWLKLTVKAEPELTGPIEDYLVGMLAAGVETGAKDEPGFGVVQAYLQQDDLDDAAVSAIVRQVTDYLENLAALLQKEVPVLAWEMIEEQDWGKSWKSYFEPFAIIPGLVIAPSWADYQPQPDEQVIVMDPGMAFGTGHHATTRLCLQYLQENVHEGKTETLLDVGTGTGILGMAGLLFGVKQVLAIDNDPEAVRVAGENAAANGLAAEMKVELTPLTALTGAYDIVVANIVHDVLVGLADELIRMTRPQGLLILSGLLAEGQCASIEKKFVTAGCRCLDMRSSGEWAAICLQRIAA